MKNKLYYLLAVSYIAVFALILYINGVFTGEAALSSNLVINVAFLIIIGILFCLSFASFIRLNQVTQALVFAAKEMRNEYEAKHRNLWPEYQEKQDVFSSSILNQQFRKYQKKIASHTGPRGVITSTCSIGEYINEDLLDQVGSSFYNSAMSGTMTGLGILGTFLGLSLGMNSFSGNDIYTITDNVAPLLSGMKVAFHTSVYGIFFSLIFTFVYRSLMADAYTKLTDFLAVFEECTAPVANAMDDNMNAMLIYQSNMAKSMKSISDMLRGYTDSQVRGVDQIVQQFLAQMTGSMDAEFKQLGKTLHDACEAQATYAENFQRLEESTRLLLSASQNMNETMHLALEKQQEISEKISSTCDDLSNELYTFDQMRNMYEK